MSMVNEGKYLTKVLKFAFESREMFMNITMVCGMDVLLSVIDCDSPML